MNSDSTLDVKKKMLYGIVIGVRQRPADDGTGRPAHGLFRILLENRCVHVMDDRLYQDCRDRFNNARRVVKREAAMQVLLQDYQRHERERALYASVWDQPTGLATLVAGGTVSDLQSVAPVGCDVAVARRRGTAGKAPCSDLTLEDAWDSSVDDRYLLLCPCFLVLVFEVSLEFLVVTPPPTLTCHSDPLAPGRPIRYIDRCSS